MATRDVEADVLLKDEDGVASVKTARRFPLRVFVGGVFALAGTACLALTRPVVANSEQLVVANPVYVQEYSASPPGNAPSACQSCYPQQCKNQIGVFNCPSATPVWSKAAGACVPSMTACSPSILPYNAPPAAPAPSQDYCILCSSQCTTSMPPIPGQNPVWTTCPAQYQYYSTKWSGCVAQVSDCYSGSRPTTVPTGSASSAPNSPITTTKPGAPTCNQDTGISCNLASSACNPAGDSSKWTCALNWGYKCTCKANYCYDKKSGKCI